MIGVGRQRFADQLVRDVRTIEVAGVDMVDAARDRFTQHRQCPVMVFRRPEHAGPGELHRAVAKAFDGTMAERERA